MSTSKDGDFAIVKFPDEGDAVAVVRRSWISGGMCMWPQKAKNVQKMVRSCTEPGSGWIQTTCVVLGMYDNYKEARNKLSKAELTLDTDPDEPRWRRKKRQFDSSSDESVEPYSLPTPSTLPRMPFAAFELLNGALQPELLRLLHGIRHRQLEHSSQLNFLTSWTMMWTMILEFDDSLKRSASMKKQLKTRWKKLGGTGIVDATRRVLKDLLSDHVAMHYSWQGGKGKRHFRETACCEVMLDVLTSRTTCDGTVAEIEKVTKSRLRHAKERMERKTVKHPDDGGTNDEAALPTDLEEASIMDETSHRLLDIEADNDDSDL
ncbi:uncharacterized protein [Dermacentor albipictus]|uniref:uncharacterized protein n=1 Tax=Dermacentor albipictus TaxID=60249 RepID=UPI0038FC5644